MVFLNMNDGASKHTCTGNNESDTDRLHAGERGSSELAAPMPSMRYSKTGMDVAPKGPWPVFIARPAV